ncbi:MAG: DUF1080 domain-containing protein [Verrucomicrobia bacterium]|nr:DUF1080 domain-containing protein [Verrucomicrobiota bacterium]
MILHLTTSEKPTTTQTTNMKIALLLALALTAVHAQAGSWIRLFDGKPTDKLRGYRQQSFPTQNWVIDNGALKTVPGKSADLATTESFKNFDLRFEWKVSNGGNSGIIYNVAEINAPAYETGPEYQVLDNLVHPDGKNPKTSAGALYALLAPSPNHSLKKVGEFNTGRIVSKNGKVEHYVNGKKVLEYQWGSPEVKALVAQSKFKNMAGFMTHTEGLIVFQHHGEEVWYRNIKIRKL